MLNININSKPKDGSIVGGDKEYLVLVEKVVEPGITL